MIKNAIELRANLKDLQRQALQQKPSRVALAQSLENLAAEVWSAPRKRAPKKPPKPVPPRELANVGKLEQEGLEHFRKYIGFAIDGLANEIKKIEKRTAENIADEYSPEDARKAAEDRIDVDEIGGDLASGLDRLALNLSTAAEVTYEEDLAEAVEAFRADVKESDDWVEDAKVLEPALATLEKAQKVLPTQLTGPGALRKLQECFDFIAEACNKLYKKRISAPKIPRALDPEDPRQLGFGFSASLARIRNPRELHAALEAIHALALQPYPSRRAVAIRLARVASALLG